MEITRYVPGGGCPRCDERCVYETPRRCRCPNCGGQYTPGQPDSREFHVEIEVVVRK